ncbi:MAG: hypothetical protein Q8K82_19875 [Gemmatimonadaceae bacterium]|nr:hypothetical protein [Gemmatimonadaceae bacterium]
MQTATTHADERLAALDAFRACRARFSGTGCNYWVFERSDQPGVFTQFFEAGDEHTLRCARYAALGANDNDPIFREVEL